MNSDINNCSLYKVPLNEYKNIKSLYLSGMNSKDLSTKDRITIRNLLKRIGV